MNDLIVQKAAQMGMTDLTFDKVMELMMPNTRNRINLRGQMDLLADGHADIMGTASRANNRFILGDAGDKPSPVQLRFAINNLSNLTVLLKSQRDRLCRVIAEVEEIKKNVKV
jgi:hypothetical protein